MEIGRAMTCLLLILSTTADGLPVNQTNIDVPFVLTHSPLKVYPGFTSNLELRCARNPDADTSLKEILWMRILKYTSDQSWVVVAEQKEGQIPVGSSQDVITSGSLTPMVQSYLSVVWTETDNSMLGSYKCIILGLDQHLSFIVDETSKIEIKAKKIAEADLLNIILDTEENIRDNLESNKREIIDKVRVMENYSRSSEQSFDTVIDKIDKANISVDSIMAKFLYPNTEQMWPAGTYGILRPEVGCPEDLSFYEGNTGYFKFHAESSTIRPANDHSKTSHLSRPIFTSYSVNNFMTLRFCVTNGVYNVGGAWPEGRYCFHRKGTCPVGFNSGTITVKTESWGNLDALGGNVPDTSPTTMYFCCRTHGNPTVPIVLPTNHPFYLYQYDGRCQQVKGMQVTEEFVQLDTEPGSSGSSYHPYLPAGNSGGILRLELCYYTKN